MAAAALRAAVMAMIVAVFVAGIGFSQARMLPRLEASSSSSPTSVNLVPPPQKPLKVPSSAWSLLLKPVKNGRYNGIRSLLVEDFECVVDVENVSRLHAFLCTTRAKYRRELLQQRLQMLKNPLRPLCCVGILLPVVCLYAYGWACDRFGCYLDVSRKFPHLHLKKL